MYSFYHRSVRTSQIAKITMTTIRVAAEVTTRQKRLSFATFYILSFLGGIEYGKSTWSDCYTCLGIFGTLELGMCAISSLMLLILLSIVVCCRSLRDKVHS